MASKPAPSASGRNRRRRRAAPDRSAARIHPAGLIGGALLAALLLWPIVTTGLAADALDHDNLDAAVNYDPRSADAATALADQRLHDSHPVEAAGFAQQALASSPLTAGAVRVLALATQARGDPKAASRLMGAGAALGWRDPLTQVWITTAALSARDYESAARHVDALGRVIDTQPLLRDIVDNIASHPEARPALARRLALNPLWREGYFTGRSTADRLLVRAAVLESLIGSAAPPTAGELRALTDNMIAASDYADAYDLWRTIVQVPPGVTVADGGFDRAAGDPDTMPAFEWRLPHQADASAAAESDGPGMQGLALHATTTGNVANVVATQTMMLAPGLHHFSVQAHFSAPGAADAFRWVLTCIPNDDVNFSSPPPAQGGAGPTIAFDLPIPPGDACPAQTLQLRVQTVSVPGPIDAWFDNVVIR